MAFKKPAGPLKRPISKVLGKGVSQYRTMWYANGRIAIRFKPSTGQETQFASAMRKIKALGLHLAQLAVTKLESGDLSEKDTTTFLKERPEGVDGQAFVLHDHKFVCLKRCVKKRFSPCIWQQPSHFFGCCSGECRQKGGVPNYVTILILGPHQRLCT